MSSENQKRSRGTQKRVHDGWRGNTTARVNDAANDQRTRTDGRPAPTAGSGARTRTHFGADREVYASVLIDCSASMQPYARDVINGHTEMLDVLRQAEKCEAGCLFVYQSLFSDVMSKLNDFHPLHPRGDMDRIRVLDQSNYQPAGQTALYDALLEAIHRLAERREGAYSRGMPSSARLAVLTDGEDNISKSRPEDVRAAIGRLRASEWLEASVIVGLSSTSFDEKKLKSLESTLGFSTSISLVRNPANIRKAFALASKVLAGKT